MLPARFDIGVLPDPFLAAAPFDRLFSAAAPATRVIGTLVILHDGDIIECPAAGLFG
ncbi:hypothetical protein I3F58_26090 [Streptomyces sp. MUM 203J]|uniref:hypothetical protein n=1 Tax=Streptomyces sp. MUM 203J TaxID=2791990 RepID=UPI001F0366B1|nr:hypothetical protein [Streptomyces sp. MUM 203J]MCH0542964.1 hypothetical protein [Streptomyces sp. MUM 203J]